MFITTIMGVIDSMSRLEIVNVLNIIMRLKGDKSGVFGGTWAIFL